jgi:hypothetical protein
MFTRIGSCLEVPVPRLAPYRTKWLRGYQRPPRGGGGSSRRACERTPLRGRRRQAPRHKITTEVPTVVKGRAIKLAD